MAENKRAVTITFTVSTDNRDTTWADIHDALGKAFMPDPNNGTTVASSIGWGGREIESLNHRGVFGRTKVEVEPEPEPVIEFGIGAIVKGRITYTRFSDLDGGRWVDDLGYVQARSDKEFSDSVRHGTYTVVSTGITEGEN